MNIQFVKMGPEHRKPIMELFNYYITTGTAAFPGTALPEAFYELLMKKAEGYPAYVLIDNDTKDVAGYCMLSPYNPFSTFKGTAMISYFISKGYTGQRLFKKAGRRGRKAEHYQPGGGNILRK